MVKNLYFNVKTSSKIKEIKSTYRKATQRPQQQNKLYPTIEKKQNEKELKKQYRDIVHK